MGIEKQKQQELAALAVFVSFESYHLKNDGYILHTYGTYIDKIPIKDGGVDKVLTIFEEFGLNVQNRRKTLGLTQEKLAEMCDLDRTTIGLIESGKSNVTLKTIDVIAKALKLHPSKLLKTD